MPKIYTPTPAPRKLRIAIFGKSKAGKTHLALSFPKPVLMPIESRNWEAFLDIFPDIKALEFDADRLGEETHDAVEQAMAGAYGDRETLVLDSWTVVEKAMKAQMTGVGQIRNGLSAKDLGGRREIIETEVLSALRGPSRTHLVFIAHETHQWSGPDDGKLRTVGVRPDATRNFDHYFDVVMHLEYNAQTRERVGTIHKSGLEHLLKNGSKHKNPTWATVFAPLVQAAAPEAPAEPRRASPLLEAWIAAGQPAGSLRSWLASREFVLVDNALSSDDRARAMNLLSELAREAATVGATAMEQTA
jgi:hypothetical protein